MRIRFQLFAVGTQPVPGGGIATLSNLYINWEAFVTSSGRDAFVGDWRECRSARASSGVDNAGGTSGAARFAKPRRPEIGWNGSGGFRNDRSRRSVSRLLQSEEASGAGWLGGWKETLLLHGLEMAWLFTLLRFALLLLTVRPKACACGWVSAAGPVWRGVGAEWPRGHFPEFRLRARSGKTRGGPLRGLGPAS